MLNKRPGLNAHKFSICTFIPKEEVSSLSVISGLVFRAYTLPVAFSCKDAKCFHLTVEKKKIGGALDSSKFFLQLVM